MDGGHGVVHWCCTGGPLWMETRTRPAATTHCTVQHIAQYFVRFLGSRVVQTTVQGCRGQTFTFSAAEAGGRPVLGRARCSLLTARIEELLGLWAFWVRGAERGGEGGEGPNHRHQTLFDPGHFLFDRIALQQRGFSQMAVERSNRPGPRCLRSDAIPLPVQPAIIMGPWDGGLDGLLMMLLDESQVLLKVKHDR